MEKDAEKNSLEHLLVLLNEVAAELDSKLAVNVELKANVCEFLVANSMTTVKDIVYYPNEIGKLIMRSIVEIVKASGTDIERPEKLVNELVELIYSDSNDKANSIEN